MPTLNQLVRKRRRPQHGKKKNKALEGRPQARGVVESITVAKPKKPNSSNKFIAKVILTRTRKHVTCYEPGEGHGLQQHSIVLVEGGPIQDLVGVRYRIIRHAKGTDSRPPYEVNSTAGAVRQQARSKYGQGQKEADQLKGLDPGDRRGQLIKAVGKKQK